MFDTINGPQDHYSGPATGLTTEKGDSWHTAVAKINASFGKIKDFISHGVESIDAAARKEIDAAHEVIISLQQKFEAMEKRIEALETRVKTLMVLVKVADLVKPADQPPAQETGTTMAGANPNENVAGQADPEKPAA